MATAKKSTTAKITTVTTKAATQKVSAPKAPSPAPKAAPAPLAVTQPIAPVAAQTKPAAKTISKGEWQAMVEQAAYYIAEKHGFSGDPQAHWAKAEAEISASLKARGISVL